MTKLQEFDDQRNALLRNRLLYSWLDDDHLRNELYAELRNTRFPVLSFKSLARPRSPGAQWLSEDVYLLSSSDHIREALKHGSVRPYAELGSGGKFMLGREHDDPGHCHQRGAAALALKFDDADLEAFAQEAVRRALVLPLKNHEFDLVKDVASQAALRYVAMLFGLPTKVHTALELLILGAYEALSFQIIGRHFASEDELPKPDKARVERLQVELAKNLDAVAGVGDRVEEWWDEGFVKPGQAVPARLNHEYVGISAEKRDGLEPVDITRIVSLGLMAGTVGNITAAISMVLHDFFQPVPASRLRVIKEAIEMARRSEDKDKKRARKALDELKGKIGESMVCNPPAPFLTRIARHDMEFGGTKVPTGAYLLLAMGASQDAELHFGGPDAKTNPHQCVGVQMAWPIVCETVRQVLLLPGLARVLDARTAKPKGLVKKWGAVCTEFPLQYQRDRKLNQRSLHVVLPIKEPVAANAERLMRITRAGAPIVEQALKEARNVHFAWFSLAEKGTHLAMHTVYDGDFDAYVEHFALKVPLFDTQFEFLDVHVPTPITRHPKEFVEVIRKYDRPPMADYFFSAYPRVSVADIDNASLEQRP